MATINTTLQTNHMKNIAIYGAGGFGKEVACMINYINSLHPDTWNLIGFFDDGEQPGTQVSHFGNVIGNFEVLNNWDKDLCIAFCIGNPITLKKVRDRITNPNINFPNLIHPNLVINDVLTCKMGEGNIIKGGCTMTCDIKIGNFNVLNGFVNIGHDVRIGDFNVIMPGARISGEVTIDNFNLIGADSFIKQQLHLGTGITLSPLSALLTKPKDNSLYIGNPAKKLKF